MNRFGHDRRVEAGGAAGRAGGRRRADALVALEAATDEVGGQEARLAEQVRGAYMTGRVTGLAVLVEAALPRTPLEVGGKKDQPPSGPRAPAAGSATALRSAVTALIATSAAPGPGRRS